MIVVILILAIVNFLANLFFGAITCTMLVKADKLIKNKKRL